MHVLLGVECAPAADTVPLHVLAAAGIDRVHGAATQAYQGSLQLTLAHLLVRPQPLPLAFRVPVGLLHQRLAGLALDVLHVRLDRMRLGLLRHAHAWHATKLRGCQLQQAHQCCAPEHSPADTAADVVVGLLGQLSALCTARDEA